jgi:uncharacterized protein YdeI (YjbR/CyaY-like superfamily)
MTMTKTSNFEQLEVSSSIELRTWLELNHTQKQSIWLVTYKKEIKDKYVSVDEVLDEVLCFGWIDGIRRKVDEKRTMQLISPRKVQHWTKSYKERFQRLEKEGKMTEAGRESVLTSKKKGLWDFMDGVDALIKPQDFVDELNKYSNAKANWDNFGPSSKRFMLRYIKVAKTLTTRTKRITEISKLASQNQKLSGS